MTRRAATRWILAITLVFLVAGLLVLPHPDRYHVDEQYYTDAALQMRATGDYLRPRYGDLLPHYLKPIVTYWMVTAGFALAGVNFLGARLFFLLAGATTLALTYRLARRLFGRRDSAVASTLVLAAHHDLWSAALRSTPDMPLVLALTACFVGFAGSLFPGDAAAAGAPSGAPSPPARRWDAWLAWPATGLAVATKGLIGILPAAWCLAVYAWRRRTEPSAPHRRPPLAPTPLAVGLLLALGWYAAIVLLNGGGALTEFYADQVGTRTGASPLRILQNAGWYLLVLPRDFLPWSLLLIPTLLAAPRTLADFARRHRAPIVFILGWYALLFVMFSSANVTRTRYFLPATPLLAALVGAFLVEALEQKKIAAALRRAAFVFPLLALLVGAVAVALGAVIDRAMMVAGVLWAAGSLALFVMARRPAPAGSPALRGIAAVAAWMLLLLAGYDLFIRPALGASPAPRFAEALAARHAGFDDVTSFDVMDRHLAQIRVLTNGIIWPRMAEGSRWDGILHTWNGTDPKTRLVLVRDNFRAPLDSLYTFEPCGFTYKRIKPADILEMARVGRAEVESRLRLNYWLGVRREPPG